MSECFIGDFASHKVVSYELLSDIINKSYGNSINMENSTALDIMTIYLRGQKTLYREAMTYSESALNMLTIPSIIINIVAGVIAAIWMSVLSQTLVVCLCALNTLIVALINQFKLGEKTEAYRTSAYHFESLETRCQFISCNMIYTKETIVLFTVLDEIEQKVIETKKANQFVLPDHITTTYPIIYNTNIFSLVKDKYIKETVLRNNLKNTVNEFYFTARLDPTPEVKAKIKKLEKLQDEQLTQIIEYKREYLHIDAEFNKEIDRNLRIKQNKWFNGFGLFNKITCGGCDVVLSWLFKNHYDKRNLLAYKRHNTEINIEHMYDQL